MNLIHPFIDNALSIFVAGECLFLVIFSVVVLIRYSKKSNRNLLHVFFTALSFLIFVILTTLAINFRIFYDGNGRFYANITAGIACILADIGLFLLFFKRK